MKILLIGASGMLGTALGKACNRKGIDYVGLTQDDLEITDSDALTDVIEKHRPDTIINTAVIQAIDPCELEPQRAFAVNALAVSNLAKLCKQKGITLVQPSTHAVFNGTKDAPYTEDDPPNPTSIYGASKYVSEFFARNLCTRHYVTRLPTLFGSSGYAFRGFAEKMLDRIKKGEEVSVATDKIDSPTYTRDAAEAIIALLEEKKPYGLYHVTNSGMVSFYDFIARVIELLGIDTKLVRAKDKDFGGLGLKPLRSALESIKIAPLRSWQEALSEYIATEVK